MKQYMYIKFLSKWQLSLGAASNEISALYYLLNMKPLPNVNTVTSS